MRDNHTELPALFHSWCENRNVIPTCVPDALRPLINSGLQTIRRLAATIELRKFHHANRSMWPDRACYATWPIVLTRFWETSFVPFISAQRLG